MSSDAYALRKLQDEWKALGGGEAVAFPLEDAPEYGFDDEDEFRAFWGRLHARGLAEHAGDERRWRLTAAGATVNPTTV
jgi:hypothetical protein